MRRLALFWSILIGSAACQTAWSATISFDFARQDGVAAGRGSGFLHSLTSTEPPPRLVNPLNIKFWRGACMLDNDLYGRLKRTGATIQYVLSDEFQDVPRGSCQDLEHHNERWPFNDPRLWREHVARVARKVLAHGWDVVWEPWNEPDFWPGNAGAQTPEAKFSQYLDAFLVAYQTIRQSELDPHARFSGPSLSARDWPTARWQIEAFLAFCAKNSLEVADLTWHVIDDPAIQEIPRRIAEIKTLAAERYPSVKVQRVLISEIVPEKHFWSPGDLIASLKYLEDGGADLVGRTCWDGCWWPTLDGSARPDAAGVFRTTSLWWANYWYASSVGQRYSGTSTNPGIVADATIRDGQLAVLLGFSQYSGPSRASEVTLNLRHLGSIAGKRVLVERLPESGDAFLESPQVISDFSVVNRGGRVELTLPSVQPGDAYLIKITSVR